jgi:ssRNA-specific RNase YbeY (16S rRNA maturation enzyme)
MIGEAALAVEVTIPCPLWERACANAAVLAETAAQLALLRSRAAPASVVDVTLTDDAAQRALNHTWRGKDAPTDDSPAGWRAAAAW